MSSGNGATRFSRSQMTPSPQSYISVNDSESDSHSSDQPSTATGVSVQLVGGEDNNNTSVMSEVVRSDSVKSLSSLIELGASDDAAKTELKKLTFDQNGTFMADFDPEKSQREMRKMNRRIHSKESKKNQLYDDKGLLLETGLDLCDCLDKECPGCHFPCPRCDSHKCSTDCRCNRKYIIDLIEVEGTDRVYNFPT